MLGQNKDSFKNYKIKIINTNGFVAYIYGEVNMLMFIWIFAIISKWNKTERFIFKIAYAGSDSTLTLVILII